MPTPVYDGVCLPAAVVTSLAPHTLHARLQLCLQRFLLDEIYFIKPRRWRRECRKMALVRIVDAGGCPPIQLRSFCADLRDEYRQRWLPEHIWSAARPSKAYDVLVNYALARTAASLERLTLFLPLKHGPLPAMGRLQHVTLQLDSSFAGLKLNWKGMPQLQTIVLLHANTEEDDCIGPMFLAELTHLQSLYLGNVVPFELYLPPSCALHLHCSRAAESRLCDNPGWFQAQGQLVSLCQRLLSAALPYQANVFVPLRGLDSLTALSVVSSTQVDVGAPGRGC